MNEDAVLGDNANLQTAAGQQLMKLAVPVPVEQRFDFGRGFVPPLLQGCFTNVLRNGDVRGVQLAVADDPDMRNPRNLFPHQLKDRAAEIARNALVRFCAFELRGEKSMVEAVDVLRRSG
jgi:hypothetical protein